MFQLGIERLLSDQNLQKRLRGKRLALLGHPASVTQQLTHSLDALIAKDLNVTAAFGPQHGMRGEKQDNMIESSDYRDPIHHIPVFSLYGEVRKPTAQMLDAFDIILIDLQDVGCRIYTFLTTLFYILDAVRPGQEVWVLDRPNPAGRPIEGNKLDMNFASFVGAAPVPMRHGLTLGEAALWYKAYKHLSVILEIVTMSDYSPNQPSGYGWPTWLSWVNPSPNMPRLSTARQYAGTVLLEGTRVSEGRGTTLPLENFGAPQFDGHKIINYMKETGADWLKGCLLRVCNYEPTFHKFKGQLVGAIQVHVDGPYYNHQEFKPYRLVCSYLRAVHYLYPDFDLWLPPPYEYEKEKMPIDILSGNSYLRQWVSSGDGTLADLENVLRKDELSWQTERTPYLLYS